jgi:excisionase family DNA binding protein
VQQLVEMGDIAAYREGKNWKIPRTLLQKYAEDRAIK